MDTVTYPHRGVERRMNESFVAYKPQIDQSDELAKRFLVFWTPGIIFVDGHENVQYRAYGYHPPEEFEHLLHVGHGMAEFGWGHYAEALTIFGHAAEDVQKTAVQPEAMYWFGVCQYKTGDKEGLKKTWNRLIDTYPASLWAMKATVIRPQTTAAAA